ncbi:unnamed protein product [Moneuplotes crassus]|uniref:Uncharacterized protein n=1 Tax=Euplotes crassus TaxID=5936 RepID=A0AAD1TZW7_EUPCR|nr:unnamed protein product [Moneuplotes crassus]
MSVIVKIEDEWIDKDITIGSQDIFQIDLRPKTSSNKRTRLDQTIKEIQVEQSHSRKSHYSINQPKRAIKISTINNPKPNPHAYLTTQTTLQNNSSPIRTPKPNSLHSPQPPSIPHPSASNYKPKIIRPITTRLQAHSQIPHSSSKTPLNKSLYSKKNGIYMLKIDGQSLNNTRGFFKPSAINMETDLQSIFKNEKLSNKQSNQLTISSKKYPMLQLSQNTRRLNPQGQPSTSSMQGTPVNCLPPKFFSITVSPKKKKVRYKSLTK